MNKVELAVREAYATHYIFTNMGYSPDEIDVSISSVANAEPPGRYSVVTLKRGSLVFNFHQVQFTTYEEELSFKTLGESSL